MAGFLTFTKEKPINRVVEVDIGEIRPNPHQPGASSTLRTSSPWQTAFSRTAFYSR